MQAVAGGAIAGHVHMRVHNARGEVTRELRFPNLVLDVGYKEWVKRLATSGLSYTNNDTPMDLANHLYLGTGTSEPTFTDSGLESRSGTLAGKANTGSAHEPYAVARTTDHDNDYYAVHYTFHFQYGEGEAEGVWTELGLSDLNYATPFTRALIRDANGDPISLTILADEYLTVFYSLDVISEPQDLGSLTVDGQASTVIFRPDNYAQISTNSSLYDRHSYLPAYDGTLIYARALTAIDLTDPSYAISSFADYVGPQSGGLSPGVDYQATGSLVLDPTDSDESVKAVVLSNNSSPDAIFDGNFGAIVFDPPLNKRADYRLTLDIDIDFTPQDGPVTGLAETATASSLDFSWDAYPNVTEYQLTLRQAGTLIEEQTVTSETASFTGLTASTEYHLDIKPIATPRNGRRLIHAASTTA